MIVGGRMLFKGIGGRKGLEGGLEVGHVKDVRIIIIWDVDSGGDSCFILESGEVGRAVMWACWHNGGGELGEGGGLTLVKENIDRVRVGIATVVKPWGQNGGREEDIVK